ncbi:CBO0543 family protein [Scopulibacillus darangshiensis]|uniref:CBO0543 family protein n=1 Tax=Scopulibacillus darangshiensis TaxID=442528 RepID=UPI003C7818DB
MLGLFLYVVAAWRWGDWRNWEKYQSTILYKIVGALLYEVLTYNYPLWEFRGSFLQSHTLVSLAITFIGFPCTVLIFLTFYPDSKIKQFFYLLFWVMLNSAMELFYHLIGLFKYDNGWNFWWSILFNCIMFPMLILHHKKPLMAYIISVPIVILILLFFNVPINKMK